MDCVSDLFTAVNDGSGVIPIDPWSLSAFTRNRDKRQTTLKVEKKDSKFEICA